MLLSRSPSGPKKYFPIPVVHLEEEIRVRSADDCKRFREEFNVSVCGTRGVGGILCLLVLGSKTPTGGVLFQDQLPRDWELLHRS